VVVVVGSVASALTLVLAAMLLLKLLVKLLLRPPELASLHARTGGGDGSGGSEVGTRIGQPEHEEDGPHDMHNYRITNHAARLHPLVPNAHNTLGAQGRLPDRTYCTNPWGRFLAY
jgi:hypothetical protein